MLLHFDTIEVIEAKSQAMLNALMEHNIQDAFKKMAEVLGTVHTRGRGLLRGRW
jgi:ribosomal protein L12E/L44/L45/RPP1/RPP2